ncbi:hypothetical protein PV327_006119 [Microctonus hyperodae]|uniref:Active regulator of SIRT1 n=1 Tax=Microctonus hyperodae TaxID=165561 RepID=A0AA39G2T2_MICHY|nr:hypothetical protein PV327_006119 [Microctonus hyperodae]
MSISLNRMSLELIDLETDVKQEKKKKNRSKNVLHLMLNNTRIIKNKKKESPIIYRQFHSKINKHTDIEKQLTQKKNLTEANVHRLLLLSSNHIDSNTADKLFERAVKRVPAPPNKECEEEKTAFTEEDFQNFAKEYFNS